MTLLQGTLCFPYLGEEVDAVGDCAHGDGVAPDKKPPKIDFIQVVQFGIEAGQLANVIADHVEQTFGHIFFGKLWKSKANYTQTEEAPVDCAFLTEPAVGERKIQGWSSFPYVWRRKVLPLEKPCIYNVLLTRRSVICLKISGKKNQNTKPM